MRKRGVSHSDTPLFIDGTPNLCYNIPRKQSYIKEDDYE